MKFLMDLHTHTVASTHAFSTLMENVKSAKEKGIEYIGITDHGPNMPGGAHIYFFQNMWVLPREIDGVKILRSAEANIINYNGEIDMQKATCKFADYLVASLHTPCIEPGTKEQNTNAIIGAMKHPKVKIIGHPDDGRYPVDYEKLVKASIEYGCVLELNNSSINPNGFRQNTRDNVITFLELCKSYNAPIAVNSDAHICTDIGRHNYALELLEEINFPEALIMNLYPQKFLDFIQFEE
jgi:putative hydrolase